MSQRLRRLKTFFESEKRKLEGKTARQKAEYIRDYYWLQITVAVVLVLVVSFVAYRAATTLKEHWFYLMIANTREEAGTDSPLWQGYVDYAGYDLTQKMVEFNDDSYFDYGKNHAAGNQYYEMFVALTDAGVLDAVVMDSAALASLGESGRLMDLDSEPCASIREKYGDRFLYALPYDTEYSEEPVPVGIDVTDSILVTQYRLYADSCALGIGAQSGSIEAVEKFLDYIYGAPQAPAGR